MHYQFCKVQLACFVNVNAIARGGLIMRVSNECLNKEATIWGFKYIGLFVAVITAVIVLCKYRMYIALISSFPGYFLGAWISSKLASGRSQRYFYRGLSLKSLFGANKLPASWRNWFL